MLALPRSPTPAMLTGTTSLTSFRRRKPFREMSRHEVAEHSAASPKWSFRLRHSPPVADKELNRYLIAQNDHRQTKKSASPTTHFAIQSRRLEVIARRLWTAGTSNR